MYTKQEASKAERIVVSKIKNQTNLIFKYDSRLYLVHYSHMLRKDGKALKKFVSKAIVKATVIANVSPLCQRYHWCGLY